MRWVVLILALCIVAAGAHQAAAALPWTMAVGQLEDVCTVWAVRPTLLVTASHCVGFLGSRYAVAYYRGVGVVATTATLVWDGFWADPPSDLALLAIDRAWPATLALSRWLPPAGAVLETTGLSVGLRRWSATLRAHGLYHQRDYGWVLVYDGPIGPGASGSPVLWRGAVVAVHVAAAGRPSLLAGVPAGTLARALRTYDRHGPMTP
jgi:hypothetical protein